MIDKTNSSISTDFFIPKDHKGREGCPRGSQLTPTQSVRVEDSALNFLGGVMPRCIKCQDHSFESDEGQFVTIAVRHGIPIDKWICRECLNENHSELINRVEVVRCS